MERTKREDLESDFKSLLEHPEATQFALCVESRARTLGLDKALSSCLKEVQDLKFRDFLEKMSTSLDFLFKVIDFLNNNDVCTSIHVYAIYNNLKNVNIANEVCSAVEIVQDFIKNSILDRESLSKMLNKVRELHAELTCRVLARRDVMVEISVAVLTDIFAHLSLLQDCLLVSEKHEYCDKILRSLCWRLDEVYACCREQKELRVRG